MLYAVFCLSHWSPLGQNVHNVASVTVNETWEKHLRGETYRLVVRYVSHLCDGPLQGPSKLPRRAHLLVPLSKAK